MSESQQAQDQKAQQLQVQYNQYQELLSDLQTQTSSITSQITEHALVDKTLTEIAPEDRAGRKCFKMIGGVLVEKSVDDVIKILNEESKELAKTKEALEKEMVTSRKEMDTWMAKNKVKIVRQ